MREDPHSAYRPDRDFLILEVKARILAAAFHVLGLKSKDEKPETAVRIIPECQNKSGIQINIRMMRYHTFIIRTIRVFSGY